MSAVDTDYAAVFEASPSAMLLLTPALVITDANAAYRDLLNRRLDQLVGRYVFDVYPGNPGDPEGGGLKALRASLRRVLETGAQDVAGPYRYDVEEPDRPGVYTERYWSPVNAPVLDADGEVTLIVHRLAEITDLVRDGGLATDERHRRMEVELYSRSRQLQRINERLRRANAQERHVALALQQAMMPPPQPLGRHACAVRYRPAVNSLNVCGDWYDVTLLPDGKYAVAVGDVVGHGLAAAGVMGQLRSALTASVRLVGGPAAALDGLDLYARCVEGALSTTAVQIVVAWAEHRLVYSSAGHPPPALVDPDGTVAFLDRATEPPLGAAPEHRHRSQATRRYCEGAVLVLYTDGLIERRGEDIDLGLGRLSDRLARHRDDDVEDLADLLMTLSASTDDTAVVVVRL